MSKPYDVLVVGCGVAGSYLAYLAAKAGLTTAIVERKRREDIGLKVCGDAVSAGYFPELGIEPPRGPELDGVFKGVKVYPPSLANSVLVKGEGYALNRYEFGQRLLRIALDAGAELYERHQVVEPLVEGSWVKGVKALRLADRRLVELRAKVTVDASGVNAVVRSRLPRSWWVAEEVPREDYNVCYRELVEVEEELVEGGYAHIFLSKVIAPGGYWWWFPKRRGLANVGLGVQWAKGMPNPRESYERRIRPKLGRHRVVHAGGGLVPTRRPISCMVWNGLVVVGDAACTANPLHGGGIGSSMLSSLHAFKAIEEALSRGEPSVEALWGYHHGYLKAYGIKQASLDVLRMYLQVMSNEDLDLIFRSRIVSGDEIYEIGHRGRLGLGILKRIPSALRLARRPTLLSRIAKVREYMVRARRLYEEFPKTPKGFEAWRYRVEQLFSEFRTWLKSLS